MRKRVDVCVLVLITGTAPLEKSELLQSQYFRSSIPPILVRRSSLLWIRPINRRPVSCMFSVTWLAGNVKEPMHLSKSRVADVVPGVVVYLHAWVGCVCGWVRSNMDCERQPEAPLQVDVRSHPMEKL